METKISIMRQFGTEQFSITTTFDHKPSQKEIEEGVASLGLGVSAAFNKVCEREETEKNQLRANAEKRQKAMKDLEAALTAETKAAKDAERAGRELERIIEKKNK